MVTSVCSIDSKYNVSWKIDLFPSPVLLGLLISWIALQLNLEYYLPHITVKSLVGLTPSPTANTSVSAGYNDFTFGGNFTLDTAKNEPLTHWTVGAGLCRPRIIIRKAVSQIGISR